jgi:hypothetical protein
MEKDLMYRWKRENRAVLWYKLVNLERTKEDKLLRRFDLSLKCNEFYIIVNKGLWWWLGK